MGLLGNSDSFISSISTHHAFNSMRKPIKSAKRRPAEYEPRGDAVPFISVNEVPSKDQTDELLHAVAHGLGIEASAAYAGLPASIVRNWLARGRKEEVTPFDPSQIADPAERKHLLNFHKQITIPCSALWIEWKKTRAKFLMAGLKKILRSKDWKAQAWLLERAEPALFNRPAAGPPIKRELNAHEEMIEAEVVKGNGENNNARVTFYCPDNGRGPG